MVQRHKQWGLSSLRHPQRSLLNILALVLSACASNNTVMLLGQKGSTAMLQLYTAGVYYSLDVELVECQPGYLYNSYNSKCQCAAALYLGLVGCNPNVYLRQRHWMGYCSTSCGDLCTAYCPYGFCKIEY